MDYDIAKGFGNVLCTYQKRSFIVPVLIDERHVDEMIMRAGWVLSITRRVRQPAGKGMSWTLGGVWVTALILYYWLSGR